MVKGICQWILYKRLGYKKIITQELPEKYIICMAPHTSNWDLILAARSYLQKDGRYSCVEKQTY